MKINTKLTILFLLGLLILAFGFFKGFTHAAGDDGPAPFDKTQVVNLVNKVRVDKQLPALKPNSDLEAAALNRANSLCQQNYFGHIDPQGRRFNIYVKEAGYNYKDTGENLAHGYVIIEHMVKAWVNSPSHYANIINPNYTETGVGSIICTEFQDGTNDHIVVQLFGSRLPADKPATDTDDEKQGLGTAVMFMTALVGGITAFVVTILVDKRKYKS